jgi:alkylated DNA repair dioxygenase AlkB
MEFPVITLNVRYIARAIPDPDAAFARLVVDIPWLDTMRARRTASFGRAYNYSGQVYPSAPMPELIQSIAGIAGTLAGHSFDNCLANFYESGENTMGFHADSYDELAPDSLIAIASFGAARPLVFRSREHAHLQSYGMEPGSMLLMDRMTQDKWQHALPRSPGAGSRISLTFRRFA